MECVEVCGIRLWSCRKKYAGRRWWLSWQCGIGLVLVRVRVKGKGEVDKPVVWTRWLTQLVEPYSFWVATAVSESMNAGGERGGCGCHPLTNDSHPTRAPTGLL